MSKLSASSVQPERASTFGAGTRLRGASEEVRVREVWNAFATWMRDDRNYAATTRHGYLVRVQHAHRWLRSNGLPGINVATSDTLRQFWSTSATSSANRNQLRAALIAFFDCLIQMGWRPDNPARALPRVKERKRLPRPIDKTDAGKLLQMAESFGPMEAAIMNLFLFTGIRNSELRNLRWTDIEGPWLRIVGKGDKERVVPIPPPALLWLNRWRQESTAPDYVFPALRHDDRPMPQSTLKALYRSLADAAAVEFVPHRLRHTYGTEMSESGDLRAVQEAMGHSNPSTTALYTRVRPGRIAEIAEKLAY